MRLRTIMALMTMLAVPATAFAADAPQTQSSGAVHEHAAQSQSSASGQAAQSQPTVKSIPLGAGIPVPEVALQNVDGKDITLAGSAGKKGTLVLFICNHCPWVKMWQGRLAEIGNAAMARGVGVVAINSNDPAAFPDDSFESMQHRAKEVGYKFAYAMDATSNVARAFGASRTPEAFLFDASGKLVYHGAVDDNAKDARAVKFAWLKDAVNAMASGKPVVVAESKALGCGIKLREPAVEGN